MVCLDILTVATIEKGRERGRESGRGGREWESVGAVGQGEREMGE